MRLECGRYDRRPRVFAMDLVLGHTKDDCDIQPRERCE
jgi:hypothetical protein